MTKENNHVSNAKTFQIIVAAALAIAIGVILNISLDVPSAWVLMVGIPGKLWLRSLQAVVIPLIFVSIVLSVSTIKTLQNGGGKRLVNTTVAYYLITTLFAIIEGILIVHFVIVPNLTIADDEQLVVDKDVVPENSRTVEEQIEGLFLGFVPANVMGAFVENELLAIIVVAITIGYLVLKPLESPVMKLVKEFERIIIIVVTFLIDLAPIGVFSLVLSSLLSSELSGSSFLFLIIGSATGIGFHFFVIYPILYILIVRKNPFAYLAKMVPAILTALSCSSSAATMPVTFECAEALKIPPAVFRFTVPLGATVNMDGSGVYFPVSVVFLAATQGITLSFVDYLMIGLISTLASIGATPIPSSGLVLIIMIAQQVNVPVTGMFSVIVAVDWLVDRLVTACNVSGDLYGCAIITEISGITHDDHLEESLEEFSK